MGRADVETAMRALLESQGTFTSGELAARTGLSRQALHRHLTRWIDTGELVREGRTRGARYRAAAAAAFERTHPTRGLAEDAVWRELEAWLNEKAPERTAAATATLGYVVTELVNNAIDHSGSDTVTLRARSQGERVELVVSDHGIGAFERLRGGLGLEDHLHALQELSKGKATTAPDRHTGEGLFFASKLVDRLELTANGLRWIVDNELADQTVEETPDHPGTQVRALVTLSSEIPPADVFDRYTHGHRFDRTRCVVRLFEYGVQLISRSEAKRLTRGLEKFREVVLDFQGVESVGQGFVDEVFRVWATAHPEVRLVPRGMNRTVEFMVKRGLPPRSGGRPGA